MDGAKLPPERRGRAVMKDERLLVMMLQSECYSCRGMGLKCRCSLPLFLFCDDNRDVFFPFEAKRESLQLEFTSVLISSCHCWPVAMVQQAGSV